MRGKSLANLFNMKINFKILGSGTSTGVPMVGCNCKVCRSKELRDKRSRASLLVSYNDKNIVADTSTDFRQQMLQNRVTHIDAVLYTHAHADHINGIDDLRGFHFLHHTVIPCYSSKNTFDILYNSFKYIFDSHVAYPALLQSIIIEKSFDLFGLEVLPIPIKHGNIESTGYRFGDLAYLTDCNEILESSKELLQGLEVLIIDGLRYTPHPFHFNIEKAIEAAQEINPKRIILTHLTHEVSCEDEKKLGVELAYDGMEINLG